MTTAELIALLTTLDQTATVMTCEGSMFVVDAYDCVHGETNIVWLNLSDVVDCNLGHSHYAN